MFRIIGQHVPPPAGVKSPMLWGNEARLRELFGDVITSLKVNRRNYVFRHRSTQHFIETFRTYYGPMNKAFGALDAVKQADLTRDLTELLQRHNRSGDATLVVPSEYVEVVAVKR